MLISALIKFTNGTNYKVLIKELNELKKLLMSLCIILFIFGAMKLMRVSFYPTGTLGANMEGVDVIYTTYGAAILYEDQTYGTFGISQVNKLSPFPIYYHYGGSDAEIRMPFSATGYGPPEGEFVVAVKIPEASKIDYISIGNHLELGDPLSDTLTLDDIRAHSNSYSVVKVAGEYVFVKTDGYSEKTWTIRAFDKDGKLIADKRFGSAPRSLD